MQQNQKRALIIIAVLIFIALIALVYWLKPDSIVSSDASNATHQPLNQLESSTAIAAQAKTGAFASASQQDIQINCQLKIDGSNRLIVNEATKNCFEFFITQYGEKDIQQIKTDFITYAKTNYKEPVLTQLIDLWTRYMQYREQLGNLEKPNIDEEKAGYYKAIFDNMKNLRKKFFSDYEVEGLFGVEDTYNDYTIARMELLDNKKLTEAEKAQKLQELFKDLPEDWKENLKQLSQLEDLRKLTAEIKARGGSAEELRQMRTNLVGPEATQRLETLDADRSQWKGRVGSYLTERDSIVKSNMSDSAKQSAIQQLRSKNFSNPQEQLRIETFEKIHDQGEKLPFSD